jgi:hypothetical protein
MKVEKLDLEEPKPWLNEIFMKTQRTRKLKRAKKSQSISLQQTSCSGFNSRGLVTTDFALKDISN